MTSSLLDIRAAGVLLHLISLPTDRGIGDMGPAAYAFVDFLVEAKQRYWQILPINPTTAESSHNAYSNTSAYAGNELLISPDLLVEDGFLTALERRTMPVVPHGLIDYDAVCAAQHAILDKAWANAASANIDSELDAFEEKHAHWLRDYARFTILRRQHPGTRWYDWPVEYRDRHPDAIEAFDTKHADEIRREVFVQWLFFRQWERLKRYANSKGISILGDIPIYVDGESAEVWSAPDCFLLDEDRKPMFITGAPPDAFSADGQIWEHPCFHWGRVQDRGFDWWIRRIRHNLELFDLTRIDHFRGFMAYWEIPATAERATEGKWVEAPGHALFETIQQTFPDMPFFAEDLGVITDDVHHLKHRFGLPGMLVLMFAFSEDLEHNPFLPHNHPEHAVVYTGTHDTNTARGWFETEANEHERAQIGHYIWRGVDADSVAHDMIEMAMASRARTAIVPIQDWLDLGTDARVNRPYNKIGNYRWRLRPEDLSKELSDRIAETTVRSDRCS